MSNNTTRGERVQAWAEALAKCPALILGLSDANAWPIRIMTSPDDDPQVAIQCNHPAYFQAWCRREDIKTDIKEFGVGLYPWIAQTEPIGGISVECLLTDDEKEAWENDIYPRDPA